MNTENAVWYKNRPLGVNKLGKMMETISVGAKLSQIYTNHSVQASAITMLSDMNVPDRHIMFISGHSIILALLRIHEGILQNDNEAHFAENAGKQCAAMSLAAISYHHIEDIQCFQ